MTKKAALGLVILLGATSLSACEGHRQADNSTSTTTAVKQVTLTFFSNNSDRTAGQGKMEQDLIDQYMQMNPDIRIKVETLSPDPQFQDKIKVYNASNHLPDIFSAWGNASFMQPLIKNQAIAELNQSDFQDLGFIPEALAGFSSAGKLYGVPRNSDFWVLYYNKKIFADHALQPPRTEAELMHVIDVLKAKAIVPIAMDGQDPWPAGIWFDTMLQRASGTWDISHKAMERTGTFKEPATTAAGLSMQKWIKAGAFGTGFLNNDYGTARNMFGQGKAAMFMMGEWEMGMAADANFPDEVKRNIGAIPLPAIDGGKGVTTDLTAWFGGGYVVAKASKHKQEAIAFLKWMFRPEGWTKAVWQNGIAFPAQTYDQFRTDKETAIQQDLTKIFMNAKSYSGTTAQDKFTPDTQKKYYDAIQNVEAGHLAPEDLAEAIDDAAEKSAIESAK
ncbi:hypothetical protein A8709_05210 [Paenibacillus pectinilyticus]|uniref:ABC transporter substrate-binding protein n=2 Tax=Paenibacillus pectinilyticus TaxID=512399 RepID=A0A1C0ZSN7_9BACL|nr:hypothetical protein A8709_05210 [Paenibacillus pectinilyticus]